MSNRLKSWVFFISFVSCVVLAILLVREVRARWRMERALRYTPAVEQAVAGITPDDIRVSSARTERGGAARRIVGRRGDATVVYTLDPRMQEIAEDLLLKNDPVAGAFVAMDSRTGAALGMAAYTRDRRGRFTARKGASFLDPMLRNSNYPLASVVKIITAAAALERGVARPDTVFTCAGALSVEGRAIRDFPHGDITLADALAKSCNSTFGQVALRVGRTGLETYFNKFVFNRRIPFDYPLIESPAYTEKGDYHVAATGAGFEGARVSPLHAAMIGAAVQNGGAMMRPFIVNEVRRGGKIIYNALPAELAHPIRKDTAEALERMMAGTVQPGGTAFQGFRKAGMDTEDTPVVGKTGSLNDNSPNENYTWFVGYPPSGKPRYVIAVMIMNDAKWKIHAAGFAGLFFKRYSDAKDSDENKQDDR